MSDGADKQKAGRESYASQTLRPLNNLALVLPLLVFFQIGATWYGTNLLLPRYIKGGLDFFGATVSFLPAMLIVGVLLAQHLAHRDKWDVRPDVVLLMIGEAAVWTVPLIAISLLTGRIMAGAADAQGSLVLHEVLTAVGAGLYEEFFFRMVLISLMMLLLVDVIGLPKAMTAVACILVAAALFGLCHFEGYFGAGEPFAWRRFIFLSAAGALWGVLYLTRGFAIAVAAHATWDIYVSFV